MTDPVSHLKSSTYNKDRRTVSLASDTGDVRECYCWGSVAWPSLQPDRMMRGHAVCFLLDIRSRIVYAVDDAEFSTVDPSVGETGAEQHPGLCGALRKWWHRYYCRRYFWHDDPTTHARYSRQVRAASMIDPKPRFTELEWRNDQTAQSIYLEYVNCRRIHIANNAGPIAEGVKAWRLAPDLPVHPAFHALIVGLGGIERFPWRAPQEERPTVILVR